MDKLKKTMEKSMKTMDKSMKIMDKSMKTREHSIKTIEKTHETRGEIDEQCKWDILSAKTKEGNLEDKKNTMKKHEKNICQLHSAPQTKPCEIKHGILKKGSGITYL